MNAPHFVALDERPRLVEATREDRETLRAAGIELAPGARCYVSTPSPAGARERDHARIERLLFVRGRSARGLRLAWRILTSEWTLGVVFVLAYLIVASLMLNEAWSVAR